MERPLRIFTRISVRWRIAVVSATLTLLILLAFALLVGQLTATNLREDFDARLGLAVADLENRLRVGQGIDGELTVRGPSLDDFASAENAEIRVLVPGGAVLAQTSNSPPLGNPSSEAVTVSGFRVVARPIQVPLGFPTVWIQYGREPNELNSTINRTWLFLFLGVAGGSLLALAAGWAVARRAMSPISGLTHAAQQITETRDPSLEIPKPAADDEVAELARTLQQMLSALNQARAETEAVLRRQREFLADASHELRTPLTSIMANLELLEQELKGARSSLELVTAAAGSSKRMRQLVSDLLVLARTDSKEGNRQERVSLSGTVTAVAQELAPLGADHVVELAIEDDVYVAGSHDELRRLVQSLLENSINHTPIGTEVTVDLSTNGGSAYLNVVDTGPGIEPELRERVFDRFYHRSQSGEKGTGLGLAIVRSVAAAHGGSVELINEPGGGARFECRLPMNR